MNKRDKFIANQIGETLLPGKTGILFVGAYHNVKEHLSEDIECREIKDTARVREYQRLLPFYSTHREDSWSWLVTLPPE